VLETIMHQITRWTLASICLMAAGCQTVTGPGGGDARGTGGAASPAELDWRKARYAEAIAGLDFSSGRVTIDAARAPDMQGASGAEAAAGQRVRADELARGGNHIEAIAAWRNAILLAPPPGEPSAYLGLGEMLRLKGRSDEAVAAFRTAIDLDPALGDAWFHLAQSLWRRGDRAEARRAMEQVTALDASRGDAHAQLARWCYYLEDDAAAWRHVHEAEALGAALPPQFRPLLEKRTPEKSSSGLQETR
jgi:tetratricopeptide (TPR) repeat protein